MRSTTEEAQDVALDAAAARIEILPDDRDVARAESHRHAHPAFRQFLAVRRGHGEVEADGALWSVGPTSVVLLPPGSVHSFSFSADAQAYLLTTSEAMMVNRVAPALGHLAPRIRHRLDAPLAFTMPASATASAEDAFRAIDLSRRWLGYGSDPVIVGFVLTILFGRHFGGADEAANPAPDSEEGRIIDSDAELLARFRALIDLHCREHIGVGRYCSLLGVSQARLIHACRTILGRTPLEVVHDRVMRDATRELLYSVKTASEIAYGLGFADPAYFSRFFKRRTGLSPGLFRSRSVVAEHP